MAKWEYKVLTHGNKKRDLSNLREKRPTLEDELNRLGSEGWEIFSYTPIYSGSLDGESGYAVAEYREVIFKRLIKD